MVYPENLSSGNLVDEHMSSMDFDGDDTDSEMEWEEENVDQGNKPSDDPCFNDVQILYNVLHCFSELRLKTIQYLTSTASSCSRYHYH